MVRRNPIEQIEKRKKTSSIEKACERSTCHLKLPPQSRALHHWIRLDVYLLLSNVPLLPTSPFFFFLLDAGATLSLSQCLSSLICVCVCDLRLSSQSVPISWFWWSDRIEFGGSWVQLLLALWEKENQKDSTTAPAAVPFHLAPTGLMLPTSTGGTTTSRGLKKKNRSKL